MKTQVVFVEGVRVLVRLDEQGRPISVISGGWKGDDAERITRLALDVAAWRFQYEAKQRKKAAHDANRTAKSTEKKRDKARNHSSHEWLEAAYTSHADYGAEKLALEARRIAALNGIGKGMRDKITEYRAKKFLKAKRSK